MIGIEDQLSEAARRLREDVERELDIDAGYSTVIGSPGPSPSPGPGVVVDGARRRFPSPPVILGAAAAVLVVVIGVAVTRGDHVQVVSGDGLGAADDAVPTTEVGPNPSEPTEPPDDQHGSVATSIPIESGSLPAAQGPDLQAPESGREITFEGVGEVLLDEVLDPVLVSSHEGGTCGYWGPIEDSHDGDEPLRGIAAGVGTDSPTVATITVGRNPTYRTASGVGVGTTLATLARVYGDRLVVDRRDGWENPTGGLLALYQDVAAVRYGDRALTFYLVEDVVAQVKVSSADFWGDDEGCA